MIACRAGYRWPTPEFAKAVKGIGNEPRVPGERKATVMKRLTKAAAHKLIGALVGS